MADGSARGKRIWTILFGVSKARPATPADIPEVVRLAAVMFTSMGMDATGATWRANAAAHARDRLGHDLAIFVVDGDEPRALAASAAGTIANRLPSPNNPAARVGYIQWVATDEAHRRRGYARQVLEEVLAWFGERGVESIELHATKDAEPLYRGLGFTEGNSVALRRRGLLA